MYLYCPCEYVKDLEVLTGDGSSAMTSQTGPLRSTAAVATRMDVSTLQPHVSDLSMEALDSQSEMVGIDYVSQVVLILSSV